MLTMFKYPNSPAIWFIGTWAIALLFWAVAPDQVVYTLVPNGRYLAVSSFLFFAGFIILCLLGFRFALSRKRPRSLARTETVFTNKQYTRLFSVYALRLSYVVIAIVLLATFVHLYEVATSEGLDMDSLAQGDLSGVGKGYKASTIHGVTILKWLNLPIFNLLVLVSALSKRWKFASLTRKIKIMITFSLSGPVVIFLTGSRTGCLVYLICYIYLRLSLRILDENSGFINKAATKKKKVISWKRFLIIMVVLGTLIFGLFSLGEYTRKLARVDSGNLQLIQASGGVINDPNASIFKISYYVLSGYFFRTINNGLLLVDQLGLGTHTVAWRLLRPLYTGFRLEDTDPGGLIGEVKSTMATLEARGMGLFTLSNSSLPGYMFIDLSWFALIVFFLFGYIVGKLYVSLFDGNITSWIILPIVVYGIMESWRCDILFRSSYALPLLFGLCMCRYLNRSLANNFARPYKRYFVKIVNRVNFNKL